MIKFKDKSVSIKVLSPALMHIFNTLYNLNAQYIPQYPKDWIITSINDGKHSVNSRHYKDEAIDLRSKNFSNTSFKLQFRDRLALALGMKFTVLLENLNEPNEHFHIQVKKGEGYS